MTVNGVAIAIGKGCYYSAYGLAGVLSGEEPLIYDVYYLAGNVAAIGPVMVRIHGGGWGGPTDGLGGNCYGSANCLSWFQNVLSGAINGMGAPPIAIYDVNYTAAELRFTGTSGPPTTGAIVGLNDTTIPVMGAIAGTWSWPQSGTYDAVIDQGLPNQETITVTSQSPSGTYTPSSLAVIRSGTRYVHATVHVFLGGGNGGEDSPGYAGTPGTYNLLFSQPATGPNWTVLPTGTYTIDSAGHVTAGNITITSQGNPGSATAMPAVTFPSGGTQGIGAYVFGSLISIPDTQFPTAQNNAAGFLSYLAHCSAGGTSPKLGSCVVFSSEPAPGNPMDIRITGDSAGSQIALTAAWSGSTFLSNRSGSPGYSEFSDTGWEITAAAPWSVPVEMAAMYNGALTRAAEYGLLGVLGWPPSSNESAMSPITYLTAASPRTLLVNGSGDEITSPLQVLTACSAQPSVVTCAIVPACPPASPAVVSTASLTPSSGSLSASATIGSAAEGPYLGLDTAPNYEIVQAYNVGAPTVSIVRGQFGTTAVSHARGVTVQNAACNHELDVFTVPGYTLGTVTDFLFPTATPSISAGGVVNAASYAGASTIVPGSIATVFGIFPNIATEQFSSVPLPTSLSSLSLQFGGDILAPLFFVTDAQVNLQVPWELAGQSQTFLSPVVNGRTGPASSLNIASFAPGIFAMNSQGNGPGAILDSSYKPVNSVNPATPGAYVQIYCTGLGTVTNQPPDGGMSPSDPLAYTATLPTVMIGGVSASVQFSGLAPGYVGLYQVNALVPATVAAGNAAPVTISIGGVTSNTVTIAVSAGPNGAQVHR